MRQVVLEFLDQFIPDVSGNSSETRINQATRYTLFERPGALWRPLLTMAVARDYGVEFKDSVDLAAGVQLAHVASLVYDDMDDCDNQRRGIQSCHSKFGDMLARYVFLKEITRTDLAVHHSVLSDKDKLEVLRLISDTKERMMNGQLEDNLGVVNKTGPKAKPYIEMYDRKTGLLAGLATRIGATVGGENQEGRREFCNYGRIIGITYQIQDDLADVEKDRKKGKKTLVTEMGVEEASTIRDNYLRYIQYSPPKNNLYYTKEVIDIIFNNVTTY